jgi:two-component system LytT family response regulator
MSHAEPNDIAGTSTRVLIVDDEPLARDCIRLALSAVDDVTIVGECGDASEAVSAIERLAPDLVFLDVQMPGMDGFAVIEALDPAAIPAVVFVTAFDAHAVRAFEVHAVDYVLKPFDDARLVAAFEHARGVLHERRRGELARQLAAVIQSWQATVPNDASVDDVAVQTRASLPGGRYVTRFAVRNDGSVRFVAAHEVDWIEADSNYIVLHVGNAAHRIRATLRDLAGELDPRRFTRIHRSAIVNVERIRELQPWFGGDYIAILRTGEKLKVSRQRVRELLRPTA